MDTDELLEHLTEFERLLLQPGVRRNTDFVSSLLSEDFREFGSSGSTYSKAEIVDALAKEVTEPSARLQAEDFEMVMLADHAALLTYRSIRITDGTFTAVHTLRSSLWIQRGEKWQIIFHQGTKTA